jgi:hypothetical protein
MRGRRSVRGRRRAHFGGEKGGMDVAVAAAMNGGQQQGEEERLGGGLTRKEKGDVSSGRRPAPRRRA